MKNKTVSVTQYAKGKAIATYASMALAAKLTGARANHISEVASGNRNTAGGYGWKRGALVNKKAATVTASTPTGESVAVLTTLDAIRNSTVVRTNRVVEALAGKRKTANGLIWR